METLAGVFLILLKIVIFVCVRNWVEVILHELFQSTWMDG